MRVLHLLDPAVLRATDYRRRTFALVDQLRAQGVHTVQLAGPDGNADAAQPPEALPEGGDGWQVYRTALPACPGWLPRSCAGAMPPVALALRLRQLLRWTRPDLIHAHAASSSTVLAALGMLTLAGRGHLPLVAEAERRGAGRRTPAWERWTLARAGALAAPSFEMRALLRSSRVACRRIAVIPPPADLAATPCQDRGPPDLEGAPLLAYAGRLARDEGIDLLLAVLPVLRKRHPALRLVVAGGGVREDELADRIGCSGARGHVVITGSLSSQRAADLLPRADIAVFPALPGGAAELAPSRHLLNAMAHGCAIVAADTASHRELLVHGHSAVLFQAGSRSGLAAALLGLLDRPERRRALGHAAAARAASQHSWPVTAARYRCLYEHVLAGRR